MISANSVPESLRLNKDVLPFINRSIELQEVHPVVSFYCKIYVIEHILKQKLYADDDRIHTFTLALLDETESIKKAEDGSSLNEVLRSRQLSLNALFVFAFKMFNSCLEDLQNYDGVSKAKIGSKIKAVLNFWSLLLLFYEQTEDIVDYSNTTGGQCLTSEEFKTFCKEKQKTLKFQLSRLIKNEIPVKNGDEELERELEQMTITESQAMNVDDDVNENREKVESELVENVHDEDVGDVDENDAVEEDKINTEEFTLPGAPSFDPSNDSDGGNFGPKLPGAPRFLPDADLTHINKKSSVVMFSPKSPESRSASEPKITKTVPEPEMKKHQNSTIKSSGAYVTKENLVSILDFSEQITKIQKHAKFAISALNYEDLATAEKELLQGLELLRQARKNLS